MHYQDKVYGNFNITEPVILELINSPALKRLRDVDQGGYGPLCAKPYAQPGQFGHNRLAHSIGVYLLLKKYGASLEEQVAGLIHDVSHSVFSHCIDYVVEGGDGKKQGHQDNLHDSFITKTQIPKILKKYKLVLSHILNDKNFSLKEKPLPDLCADRIDYSLRTAVIFKKISSKGTQNILNTLEVKNGKWIFKNFKAAKKYARLFYDLNMIHYAGQPSAIMFLAVSDCLKYALQKKYITPDDLYTTDKIVLAKIKKYLNKDEKLNLLWRRMNGKIKARKNRTDYDARVFCKSRIVDPLFMDKGKIKRLSQAEPNWGKIVKQELKPKKYFLKFDK
ncbi:MAG: HD domain-containing protein [Patescibacteria group bacterium]|nr:HD domain-containing protein [Patescibacteria group bacterium]